MRLRNTIDAIGDLGGRDAVSRKDGRFANGLPEGRLSIGHAVRTL